MNKRLLLILLSVFALNVNAQYGPALNKDGSIVTGVLTAAYDPLGGVFPFPFNLLYLDTRDFTINVPGIDESDLSDPSVALSSMDGFSPTEKWTTTFVDNSRAPGNIDPASVQPGVSVRVFEVTTAGLVAVTSIVRELTPSLEYVAFAGPGGVLAIIPTQPLKEYTSYMAVLTNDIKDVDGNDATSDQTYWLTKRRTPWVDENNKSTYPLVDDATAQALEPQRKITQSMELNAAAVGINPDDIILSWTVQTQSVTFQQKLMRSISQPAPTVLANTGMTTAALGLPGISDIYIGVISMPYYLGIPSAENPIAHTTEFWRGAPGAYIPPFDQVPGTDPTSTNITVANPFPVPTGTQTVPLLVTVPNAGSGMEKPEGGWPVVLYQHGLTRERTDMFAVADTLASVGFVVISMDQPLHGVNPDVKPELAPFYIENTPFAPIANERTFDADLINNETGAPGPDGLIDPSGSSSFNLLNLQAARDNLRQAQVDLSVLAQSVAGMDLDGDGAGDLQGFNIAVVSHSLGTIVANVTAAYEPLISHAFLASGAGGIIRTVEGGVFGETMRAALAAAGIEPGTADYEAFLIVAQTMMDSADPINWGAEASARIPILGHTVVGDIFVPNEIPGAPLAGGEAQNAIMRLVDYSSTQANPDGLRSAGRFIPPAIHQSLLDPTAAPLSTFEMQGQMASFIASGGTFIQVSNSSTMQPVVQIEVGAPEQVSARSSDGKKKAGGGGSAAETPSHKLMGLGDRNHD